MRLISAVRNFLCLILSTVALFSQLERIDLGTASYFAEPASVFMVRTPGKPLIAAHRSGKGAAPENTLKAVAECVDSDTPIDMFEIDIQITKDGELVLYHSLFLDENSNAAEFFGKENTPVFSKTYAELRNLNMGEHFRYGGAYIFQGLRGDDIPEDLRILRLEDFFAYLDTRGVLENYLYSVEIKYPFPWGPAIVDKLYAMVTAYGVADRTVVGSYWQDVTDRIDARYAGKLHRFASILECLDLYRAFYAGDDLSDYDFPYIALSLPYYEDDGRLLISRFGTAAFIDYAHQYGLSACYWTVNDEGDAAALTAAGADCLMTDYPGRLYELLYTESMR